MRFTATIMAMALQATTAPLKAMARRIIISTWSKVRYSTDCMVVDMNTFCSRAKHHPVSGRERRRAAATSVLSILLDPDNGQCGSKGGRIPWEMGSFRAVLSVGPYECVSLFQVAQP